MKKIFKVLFIVLFTITLMGCVKEEIVDTKEIVDPAEVDFSIYTQPIVDAKTAKNILAAQPDFKEIIALELICTSTGEVIWPTRIGDIFFARARYGAGTNYKVIFDAIAASTTPASGIIHDFMDGPLEITVYAADRTQKTITVEFSAAEISANDITGVNVNGRKATQVGNLFTAQIPQGNPLDAVDFETHHDGASVKLGAEETGDNPAVFTAVDASVGPLVAVVTAADGSTQAFTIAVTHVPSNEAKITDFNLIVFAGGAYGTFVKGDINERDNTITVEVPLRTDVTSLVPVIEYIGKSIYPASGTAQDFSDPVQYTVTSHAGDNETYTVEVSELPIDAKNITYIELVDWNNPSKVMSTNVVIGDNTIDATVPFGTRLDEGLIILLIHQGIRSVPPSGWIHDLTDPLGITITAADHSTKKYTLTVTHGPNPKAEITAYCLESQKEADHHICGAIGDNEISVVYPLYHCVNKDPDECLKDLTPVMIVTSHGAAVNPDEGTAQDFSDPENFPVIHTVTAEDGQNMKTYKVNTLICEENPVINDKILVEHPLGVIVPDDARRIAIAYNLDTPNLEDGYMTIDDLQAYYDARPDDNDDNNVPQLVHLSNIREEDSGLYNSTIERLTADAHDDHQGDAMRDIRDWVDPGDPIVVINDWVTVVHNGQHHTVRFVAMVNMFNGDARTWIVDKDIEKTVHDAAIDDVAGLFHQNESFEICLRRHYYSYAYDKGFDLSHTDGARPGICDLDRHKGEYMTDLQKMESKKGQEELEPLTKLEEPEELEPLTKLEEPEELEPPININGLFPDDITITLIEGALAAVYQDESNNEITEKEQVSVYFLNNGDLIDWPYDMQDYYSEDTCDANVMFDINKINESVGLIVTWKADLNIQDNMTCAFTLSNDGIEVAKLNIEINILED